MSSHRVSRGACRARRSVTLHKCPSAKWWWSTISQRRFDRHPRILVTYGSRICIPRYVCKLQHAASAPPTSARNVSQLVDQLPPSRWCPQALAPLSTHNGRTDFANVIGQALVSLRITISSFQFQPLLESDDRRSPVSASAASRVEALLLHGSVTASGASCGCIPEGGTVCSIMASTRCPKCRVDTSAFRGRDTGQSTSPPSPIFQVLGHASA